VGTRPSPSSSPSAAPGPSPEELAEERQRARADELRKLASAECAAGRFPSCAQDLDEASKLDPPGELGRGVRRLRGTLTREDIQSTMESKQAPGARSLEPSAKAKLVTAIAGSRGQALHLACAPGREPSHLCEQLSLALTSAGWTVTRKALATDAGIPLGMLLSVATDADDATQNAADALAAGLELAYLFARGPVDTAPGGDAPLTLIVGAQ